MKRTVLYSLCIIGLVSCTNYLARNSRSNLTETRTQVDTVYEKLKIVSPENIKLNHRIERSPRSTRLNCVLTNNNPFSVYLVIHTCTDLPGRIKVDSVAINTYQSYHCNGSWSKIHQIEPKDSFEFSTNLKNKDSEHITRLGLYLKFVDQYMEFETIRENPELIYNVDSIPYENCSLIMSND